jgi:DNA-binding transcriptional LysR family regulator
VPPDSSSPRASSPAVLPAGHPAAAGSSVDLAALAGEPFIDSPGGFGNRLVVDRAFAAAGLERYVVIEVTDITTTADYVRHGLGVAIMPSFAVPADDSGVRVRPVAGTPLDWSLGVAYSSARRPGAALTALLALVADYVRLPPGTP